MSNVGALGGEGGTGTGGIFVFNGPPPVLHQSKVMFLLEANMTELSLQSDGI